MLQIENPIRSQNSCRYNKLHGAMKNICCRVRWYFLKKNIKVRLLDRRRQDNTAAG